MITVKKMDIIQLLGIENESDNLRANNLIIDITERQGDQALAYLIKKGAYKIDKEEMRAELNEMVELSLLTINQWEQMLNILDHAGDGESRIANYLRKKRRFEIV